MTRTRDPEATRQLLLQAAFEEIYAHGFQAASLDSILAKTGVTKGALYHHFKNKLALGYAVVDEVIRPMMRESWVDSMATGDDPIQAIAETFHNAHHERGEMASQLGCPLNNLAQEMSGLDEGFRQRIQRALETWHQGLAQALRRGQSKGFVDESVDPERAATFILASLEGIIGLAKNAQSTEVFHDSWYGLERFLDSLRPASRQVA
jgi:AcrR family transcriptional regulator